MKEKLPFHIAMARKTGRQPVMPPGPGSAARSQAPAARPAAAPSPAPARPAPPALEAATLNGLAAEILSFSQRFEAVPLGQRKNPQRVLGRLSALETLTRDRLPAPQAPAPVSRPVPPAQPAVAPQATPVITAKLSESLDPSARDPRVLEALLKLKQRAALKSRF